MLPQRLDMLIAFKSIGLARDVSRTEAQVAIALLDHFNQKTTQCDPSIDTLATLLGIHRRTTIRAIKRLVILKYFRKIRHGGNFHRNFYVPLWPRFRELEAEWHHRRRAHSHRFRETKLSPWQGQPEHSAGGQDVTQTSLINTSNETLPGASVLDVPHKHYPPNCPKGSAKEAYSPIPHPNRPMFHVKKTSSRDAAYASAERRWTQAILHRFVATPAVYGEIIDAIDQEMHSAATEAEIIRHGAGFGYILNRLTVLRLLNPADGGKGPLIL